MKAKSKSVVVIGSVNMDLMLRCPHLPAAGETILGRDFVQAPGGKGANQAIAAARLGATVGFVGCIGDDGYGHVSRESFMANNVDVSHLHSIEGKSTGIAMITSDDQGENCIALAPGANESLSTEHIDQAQTLIAEAGLVVCQLESPLATVLYALELANRHGTPFLLNPSPARELPTSALAMLDMLVLNEIEADLLSGCAIKTIDQARQAADLLRSRGIKVVVITLGQNGAVVATSDGNKHFPAPHVKAIDTTGAGDTLVGALAAAWASGLNVPQAMAFAQAAAAYSVTRRGAQASMPRLSDLTQLSSAVLETA
jgi:ribokinase